MDNIMHKPEISVIFTSYNHREYLQQSLDALINQSFKNFEIIIVDDCSTDGSQEVLKEYASVDSRIRLYLNDSNSGSYVNSTNYGASLATAPFLIFAQCDDYASLMQLDSLISVRKRHSECKVVFSASALVNGVGEYICSDFNVRSNKFKKIVDENNVIKSRQATELLLNECIIPNLGAALVDRSLFNEIGGLSNSYKVLADWDFWLECSLRTDFYYIKSTLNNFRQHDTTIRSTIKVEMQLSELYSMYKKFRDKNNKLSFTEINKSVGVLFWGLVSPISLSNLLSTFILSIKSVKFHSLQPLYIYFGLFNLIFNRIRVKFF